MESKTRVLLGWCTVCVFSSFGMEIQEKRLFELREEEQIQTREDFDKIFWRSMKQEVPFPPHEEYKTCIPDSAERFNSKFFWDDFLNNGTISTSFSASRTQRLMDHIAMIHNWEALKYYWRRELLHAVGVKVPGAANEWIRLNGSEVSDKVLLFNEEDAEIYLHYPICYQFRKLLHEKYRRTKKYYGIETERGKQAKKDRLKELLYGEECEEDTDKGRPFPPPSMNSSTQFRHYFRSAKPYYGTPSNVAFQKIVERIEPIFQERECEISRAEKVRLAMNKRYYGEDNRFDRIKFSILHPLFARMLHPL